MSTSTIDRPDVDVTTTLDEHVVEDLSKKTHIVSPSMNTQLWAFLRLGDIGGREGTQMLVDYARAHGIAIVALCKYIWIPTEKPGNHDVCGACMAIAQQWIGEDEG